MRQNLRIGLFGFGVVGQGLYDVLASSRGLQAEIVRICVKHADKPRRLPAEMFTLNAHELLDDPDINLIVELIDNADEAYEIVRTAMQRGKHVVTANKKMVAEHFAELVSLQAQTGVSLLYEGSSCGSIPIIRSLEEYYDNELLSSVEGIFNGTTNYILTKVCNEGLDYATALKQAQELGFAESNPYLDVYGHDAKFKLCIVAAHAFGIFARPEQVFTYGIPTLGVNDIRLAREKGFRIKLLANARKLGQKVVLFVMPAFVRPDNALYKVENEYNGVLVTGAFSDRQFLQGKGAGSHPTGSAVLSDVSAISYYYRYEYKKHQQNGSHELTNEVLLSVYLRYTDEAQIADFGFEEIFERHYEPREQFFYVAGRIRLSRLMALPDLPEREVFLALLPEPEVELV